MLKLYYAVGSDPIVVGGLDYSTYYKSLVSQNKYNAAAAGSGNSVQEITGVDNNFRVASGLDAAIDINTFDTSETILQLYRDANCTQPLGMCIRYHSYAVGAYIGKQVSWIVAPGMGFDNINSEGVLLWEGWAYPASSSHGATQLYSPYLSKTKEDTMLTMFENMIKVESTIARSKGPGGITRLCDSGLLMPFITMQAGSGLTIWKAAVRSKGMLKHFVNAATMYYLYYRERILPVSEMTVNGAPHYPAMVYNPTHFDGTAYTYSAEDTAGDYKFGYDETIIEDRFEIVAGEYDVDGTIYTEEAHFNPMFIQLPGNIYQENTITMKQYLGATIPYNETRGRYLGWDNQIAYLQHYTYTNPITFILQTAATNSIKNSCLQTGTNAYQIATDLGNVPKLVIGQVPNVDEDWFIVDYINNPNTNTATGNDWIERLFANNTDPEDSNYEAPSIDDDIPETGESDFGGQSDEESIGGDGTWTASDDNTETDFDNPDLSEDANSPLPDGVFDDLNGNVWYVKLNSAQFADLCDVLWVDSDTSIMRMLKENLGQAQINQAIVSAKTGFLDIPSQGTAQITGIAGFGIDAIGCSTINQYNRYNLGKVTVEKVFGNFLDYQAQIELSLPFAGTICIPPAICMGKEIQVGLTVDAIAGTGVYTVQCDGHLFAEVNCNYAIDIPLSTSDYTKSAISIMEQAANIANNSFGYKPGKDAAAASDPEPVMTGWVEDGAGNVLNRSYEMSAATAGHSATSGALTLGGQTATGLGGAAAAVGVAASGASLMTRYDQSRETSLVQGGGGPGTFGAMGNHYAMLRISRPYVRIDDDYYHFNGAPSDIICQLDTCKGYAEVGKIIPAFSCTDAELADLQQVLRNGVYF